MDTPLPLNSHDIGTSRWQLMIGCYTISPLCVPKTLNPTIVVMKSAKDGA